MKATAFTLEAVGQALVSFLLLAAAARLLPLEQFGALAFVTAIAGAQQPIVAFGTQSIIYGRAAAQPARRSYLGWSAFTITAEGRIGERHEPETHAIPLALQTALGQRSGFKLFGDDYDTRDGTAVRDYIHVLDLADAHVRALKYLLGGGETTVFNLGTGTGTTVKELIEAIRRTTNKPFEVEIAPRRPGDAPCLVANNSRAHEVLGWRPTRTLDDIVRSAWRWHAAEQARLEG